MENIKIALLNEDFTICKVSSAQGIDFEQAYTFFSKTDEETSLVCRSADVPSNCTDVEPGWRGFRVSGVLDFNLVGILSQIAGILADAQISLFVVSTFNTDYIFVKDPEFDRAVSLLRQNGYEVL